MNRLKESRLKKGISQKQVALALNVSPPTVSQWEAGLYFPKYEHLMKLAEIYEVSPDYLSGKDTKKEPATNGKLSPNAQELIDKLSQMDQDQLQALEKAVDLVLSLRKE